MPGINEQMEHGFKYEPDEHLNSPLLYQNVSCNELKRVRDIVSKLFFRV